MALNRSFGSFIIQLQCTNKHQLQTPQSSRQQATSTLAWHYQRNHALLQRFFTWATIDTRTIPETTRGKLLAPRVHVSYSGTECENVNVTATCYPVTYTAVINIKVYLPDRSFKLIYRFKFSEFPINLRPEYRS